MQRVEGRKRIPTLAKGSVWVWRLFRSAPMSGNTGWNPGLTSHFTLHSWPLTITFPLERVHRLYLGRSSSALEENKTSMTAPVVTNESLLPSARCS